MTVDIQWNNGYMKLNLDQFFPTTTMRARQVFKLMRNDTQHDFECVRKYFVKKAKLARSRKELWLEYITLFDKMVG